MKKEASFSWGKEEKFTLQEFKNQMVRSPVLGFYNRCLRTKITDVSCVGLGAVLI
jgi:hypothetical protein